MTGEVQEQQTEQQQTEGKDQGKEQKQETPEQLWEKAKTERATEARAEAPPAEQKGEQQKPEGEKPESAAADPLAGLPEPTRKMLESMQAAQAAQEKLLKKQSQQLATANGTIGNLKQRLDESHTALKRFEPAAVAVETQAKAEADAKAKAKAEARKKAREKLADFLDEEELNVLLPADEEPAAKPEKPEPKAEEKPAPAKTVETPEQVEARLTRERELSDLHPGWIQTVKSDGFKEWLKAQPDDVRTLAQSDDVDDAAQLLDGFKKHKDEAAEAARLEADRKKRLERGESVQGRSGGGGDTPSADALWEKAKRDREKARAA